MAFDADPASGVSVYDSYNNGTSTPWDVLGGTSVAAPCWAGIIAIADQGRVANGHAVLNGVNDTLPGIYQMSANNFHDITTGNNGYSTRPGYDLVTGRGSPIANLLVPALAGSVAGVSTTTAVSAAPNPTTFGQMVTLTATVTGTGGTPTGSVTFFDGASLLGSVTLNAGATASLAVSTLAAGTHTITAVYGGNTNFAASASGAMTETVMAVPTSTLTSAPNPSLVGQSVTFTATLVGSSSVPTGTVTFQDSGTSIGTGKLSSAANSSPTAASKRAASLAGRNRAIPSIPPWRAASPTAVPTRRNLGPPAHWGTLRRPWRRHPVPSTSSAWWLQSDGNTPNEFSASWNGSVLFDQLNIPAGSYQQHSFTVTATGTSTTVLLGFRDDPGYLYLDNVSVVPLTAVATFTTSSLAAGTHSITAAYGGDSNFAASTSAGLAQTVSSADTSTSTTATSPANPAGFGQTVTVTGSDGTPTLTVGFLTGSLNGGSITLIIDTWTVGSQSITAGSSGTSNVAGSTLGTVSQTVNNYGTTTPVASSTEGTSAFGQSITFTTTVSATSPGAATGVVTFNTSGSSIGTAAPQRQCPVEIQRVHAAGGNAHDHDASAGPPESEAPTHPPRGTDAGLKELAGLKSLQSLYFVATPVTDAGLKEMRKALPGCRIIR